jgi:DNA-binding beta-propeller fold protein YncE
VKSLALAFSVLCCGCRPSSDPAGPAPLLVFPSKPAWPERPTTPAPNAGRLLVTNNLDDSVSFFDASKIGQPSFPELSRQPVGLNPIETEAPHHAAISAAGDFYFVGLSNYAPGIGTGPHAGHGTSDVSGTVLKIRASDNFPVATARVDRNPGDLAISADGKLLAVSHFDLLRITQAQRKEVPDPDARVLFLDADTLTVKAKVRVCPAPHGVLFSKDGKRLYVACYSDEVAVIALDVEGFPFTRVKVASNAGDAYRAIYQPYALAESPLTGDVFISCPASGEVRVLTASTLAIDDARTRLVGGSPFLSAFSADGNTLWVPHQGDDRISELDPSTGTQRRQLTPTRGTCTNIHSVLPTGDGKFLIAVCEGFHVLPGSIVVLDALTGATVSATPVGVYPDFVGFLRTP